MKNIAVIQLKQLGDVLITSSLFKNLKHAYPDATLDYIIYDYTAGIVENNPYVDNLITINPKERENLFSLFKKGIRLRKNIYGYTVDVIRNFKRRLICFFFETDLRIVINDVEQMISDLVQNNDIRNNILIKD